MKKIIDEIIREADKLKEPSVRINAARKIEKILKECKSEYYNDKRLLTPISQGTFRRWINIGKGSPSRLNSAEKQVIRDIYKRLPDNKRYFDLKTFFLHTEREENRTGDIFNLTKFIVNYINSHKL